jgi:hypothetical protein
MRRTVLILAGACLLAAPTVLAFYSGGYFAQPRLIAGIVIWALVLLVAAVGPAPLPHQRAGRLALAGLVALTAWSALSILWAPQGGPASRTSSGSCSTSAPSCWRSARCGRPGCAARSSRRSPPAPRS